MFLDTVPWYSPIFGHTPWLYHPYHDNTIFGQEQWLHLNFLDKYHGNIIILFDGITKQIR